MIFSDSFNGDEARIGSRSPKTLKYLGIFPSARRCGKRARKRKLLLG
jgi:hypothetical protein